MQATRNERTGKPRPAPFPSGTGRGGGAAIGGPRPARVDRLESTVSNVKFDEPEPVGLFALIPCRCRSRTCEKCGPCLGWRVRQNMLSKAHLFSRPAMLSLTVDRSCFSSPEAAHGAITEGKFIARLLRLLGVKLWLWVLEFQTKSGDGWPHWHVLIDLDDVPGKRIDLPRAWRLWRDKWHLGGLDLSVKQARTREHAIHYITKYLTKMPESFPVWVLLRGKAIRFVQGCKAIGSLTGQPPRERSEPEPKDQLDLPFREPRSCLLERMAHCEMTCKVMCVDGDNLAGVGGWSWMGSARAVPADLIDLSEQGLISARLAAVDWGDHELLVMTPNSVGGVMRAMKRLNDELADRDVGYADEWAERVLSRKCDLLERACVFWHERKLAASMN